MLEQSKFVIHKVKNHDSYRLRYDDKIIGFYPSKEVCLEIIDNCLKYDSLPGDGVNYGESRTNKKKHEGDTRCAIERVAKWIPY